MIFERLIAKRHPWVRLVGQESPGFVYNIKEMAKKQKRYKTTTFWVIHRRALGGQYGAKGLLPEAYPDRQFPLDRDPLIQLHLVHDAR